MEHIKLDIQHYNGRQWVLTKDVEGEPVDLGVHRKYQYVIHKDCGNPNTFTVSEVTTGCAVTARNSTKQGAIRAAKKRLENTSENNLAELVDMALDRLEQLKTTTPLPEPEQGKDSLKIDMKQHKREVDSSNT